MKDEKRMWSLGRVAQSWSLILGQVLRVSYCDKEAGTAEAEGQAESGQQGGRELHTQAVNPHCSAEPALGFGQSLPHPGRG